MNLINDNYCTWINELRPRANTISINSIEEPIINTLTDAFNCFMGTELDCLAIGNCILEKNKQNPDLKKDYKKEFEID